MDLGESHTFQYTIDISPPPKKTKTKPARKAKVKKPPKPKVTKAKPKVKKPPKQRTRITPEERAQRRRAYEQARSQLPHRRERNRVEAKNATGKQRSWAFAGPAQAPPCRGRPGARTASRNAGRSEFRPRRRLSSRGMRPWTSHCSSEDWPKA